MISRNIQRTLRFRPRQAAHEWREKRGFEGLPEPGLKIADLKRALAENRVTILLQPQICLATGKVAGVEALARLIGEDGALISPADFLPLAEKTGLIRPLGRRLFELVCQAAGQLTAVGRGDLRVAINLSVIQLADPDEVGVLLGILEDSGVLPGRMEIELTESAAIRNFAIVRQQLQRFRALGASVAIDDFGTGFCSLAYLLELDVDRLKIDRCFISAIHRSRRSGLADSVINLGRKLSLDVIAEGVETEAEADWLRRHGCPGAQGFLFSRPLPMQELLAELAVRDLPKVRRLSVRLRHLAAAAASWLGSSIPPINSPTPTVAGVSS